MSKIPDYLLKPSYDNTTAPEVAKKLAQLKKKNEMKYVEKRQYRFRPAMFKVDPVDKIVNPQNHAVRSTTDQQQIQELLRLAKITAKTARSNRDDQGYDAEKKKFMQSFSLMISKYNLTSQLNEALKRS